ncbi:hypothetical protein M407DRAFT_4539 [Tulasnella calospora MUT 4182]|uniref:Uncharacterized protein n=1 Tax=Tulasnella calospora MUT 4182 TaxID=1051891 RepID=A0A0C3MF57_9AGAM|nr:hypothetical protein M407DRAFT_4539 [Tulasnella calospora MUT 4182]
MAWEGDGVDPWALNLSTPAGHHFALHSFLSTVERTTTILYLRRAHSKRRMVGSRLHDTRLLENLVKCEKEYQTALANVLGLSHSSVAALAAYGAALSPTNSRAAVGVAQTLSDADDALRSYADSIDDWREKLGEIRKLDAEIEVASRDREILITRLIKVSKQKPKGSSNAVATSSSGTKLAIAQSELQACEAHLATKQQELEELIRSALLDGLEKRCKAMTECGTIWSQKGREGLVALEDLQNAPPANGSTHPYSSYVPRPAYTRMREGNHSMDSNTSLAPSQSASQVGVNHVSPRPSEDTHITTASSGKPLSPIRTSLVMQAAVPSPTHESYRLDIPPAHSINDHVLPSGTPAPTQEGGDELDLNSSSASEDERNVQVHDNPIRAPVHVQTPVVNTEAIKMAVQGGGQIAPPTEPRASTTDFHRHGTLSKRPAKPPTTAPRQQPVEHDSGAEDKARKRSSSSLFGSFAGLFSHRSKSSAASGSRGDPPSPTKTRPRVAERDASPPRHRPQASGSGWQTRTDRNLREGKPEMVVGAGRAAAESSSEDEAAKKKGFFAIKKNDKSGKGKVREVEGPPPGGLAGGFLMRKKTTGSEQVRRRSRTVDEGTATHRLSRHSSDGELHRANSLSKRREVSPRRSRDDADLRRGSSVPPAPQPGPSNPTPTTNPAPTPASKDTAQQPKGGKIRKKAPAKHFDDGLGSAGGSLLKGAAAATAAASHAPSSPNAATGNTSLGGMGLPSSSGGLSRSSTVRSANASVAGGRTTSLGRGPAPVGNTQTNRRSSLQHDGLMAGVVAFAKRFRRVQG